MMARLVHDDSKTRRWYPLAPLSSKIALLTWCRHRNLSLPFAERFARSIPCEEAKRRDA